MSWYRRFQRLPNVPRQRYTDEIILFADSAGALKTVDEDGTVAAVAGAGSLPSPTNDGDVLTVVSGDWAGAPGGGSQPGAVRRLTVDVAAADLADGIVTLYTPSAGEVVGPVYLYDVVFCNNSGAIVIGRDEQVDGDIDAPPLAAWDSDLSRDGASFSAEAVAATHIAQVPLTTGAVTAGFGKAALTLGTPDDHWRAATAYAGDPTYAEVVEAGHIWYAAPGGTSGGSKPDFAGNIGGTVSDNGITWNDSGAAATVGSATVSFDVCVPDTA